MENINHFQMIVRRFDTLPSLPGIAIKLIEAVQEPEPDIRKIGKLISSDAALSAKLLKIINSSFYSLPIKITTVDQAIKLLGLNAVENISLSLLLSVNFFKKSSHGIDLIPFWKDSLTGAIAAKILAERIKLKNGADIFFLGLLADIGSLSLAHLFPDPYSLVFSEMQKSGIGAYDAENQVLGFNHSDVGALLTQSWGLPETFHIPVQHHHCLETLPDNCNDDIQMRTRILHLASLYIDLFHVRDMTHNLCYIQHYLRLYGLDDAIDPSDVARSLFHQTREIFPIFDVQITDDDELEALLEKGRQELVKISIHLVSEMIQRKSEMESLRRQAHMDELTQLHNYKAFLDQLRHETGRALRYQTPLTLILGDIDHFKRVNDGFGHQAGDKVLGVIAQCLRNNLRESDFVARCGGEEFAILLPETTIEDALPVAERLRRTIKAQEIMYDEHVIRVTISLGLAPFLRTNGVSPEDFYKIADRALYTSKNKGRDICSIADNGSHAVAMACI